MILDRRMPDASIAANEAIIDRGSGGGDVCDARSLVRSVIGASVVISLRFTSHFTICPSVQGCDCELRSAKEGGGLDA